MYTIIEAKKVIDGTGNPPLENAALLIEGSTIKAVGKAGEVKAPEGSPAERIDCSAYVITPGLWESHTHLVMDAGVDPRLQIYAEDDETLTLRAAINANKALKAGITSLKDCGGRNRTTFIAREAGKKGVLALPRLFLSGMPITITGGHCFYLGAECDGPVAARQKVREMVKYGADYIKIMATGGGMTPETQVRFPSFSVEELRAIAEEAHTHGRVVTAHCHAAKGIANCIEAGIDGIEHATFVHEDWSIKYDPKIGQALAKRGMAVMATLSAGYRALEEGKGLISAQRMESYRKSMAIKEERFRAMYEEGVNLVTGADSGVAFTPHEGLHLEMEQMAQYGMSPMEVIEATTRKPAAFLGMGDRLGTLEPGKEADLVALAADPLQGLEAYRDVRMVMLAGTKIV